MSTPSDFAAFQYEIYLGGMGGTVPGFPLSVDELRAKAMEAMSPEARDYVEGGAGTEDTMHENREAFRRWRLVPRVLTDVTTRYLSTSLLGADLPAPLLLAPIGVQSLVHEEGEVAVARAAASLRIPMILSTLSSRTLEEVAEANGDSTRWFQLYWPSQPELTQSFVRRAEEAGYGAIVVTLDTRLLAWRPRDLQRAFLPFLRREGIANYLSDPVFRAGLPGPPEEHPQEAITHWISVYSYPATTWGHLAQLREWTSLPIVLKGVLHPDDAREAVAAGINALIVSNHGGRQIDGEIATLDALPGIVEAVGDRIPVMLDSGIRTGSDALKALALGARAVLVGRPYIWGLALGGADGVRSVLRGLLAELELTLALLGVTRVDDLDPSVLVRRSG